MNSCFLPRGGFLLFLCSAATSTYAAGLEAVHVTTTAAAQWTDNLSRTSFEPTRQDAASYEFGVAADLTRGVARNLTGDAALEANAVAVPEFDRTNTLTVGSRFGLQHKFGLGPLAPALRLEAGLSYNAARIHANRGGTAEAALRYSQRLTSAVRVTASGEWGEHYARSSTFDIQQRTVSLEVTWDLSEHWRLSGSVGRLTGRIVANAAPQIWAQAISGGLGATVFDYYSTIPAEVTNAYGPGWVAYNLAAHADLWSLALSTRLSDRTSVEIRASSVFVENKIGVRYPTMGLKLGVAHRF